VLKRYQVLLSDWLEDYIKFLSDKYDVSTSELIRIQLCIAILAVRQYHFCMFFWLFLSQKRSKQQTQVYVFPCL